VIFITSVKGDPVRISERALVHAKLEWRRYRVGKEFWRIAKPFWYNVRLWQTDRRSDVLWQHSL